MTTLVCKFLSLLFLAVGFGFMVIAGNETFNAVQSVGAMFIGLICMVSGGVIGALASSPATEQN